MDRLDLSCTLVAFEPARFDQFLQVLASSFQRCPLQRDRLAIVGQLPTCLLLHFNCPFRASIDRPSMALARAPFTVLVSSRTLGVRSVSAAFLDALSGMLSHVFSMLALHQRTSSRLLLLNPMPRAAFAMPLERTRRSFSVWLHDRVDPGDIVVAAAFRQSLAGRALLPTPYVDRRASNLCSPSLHHRSMPTARRRS